MVEFESLILEASVVEDFEKELDNLSARLAEIDAQEESVSPIEIEARVGGALAKLEAVNQQLDRIDRSDATAHVDVEREFGFDPDAHTVAQLTRLQQGEALHGRTGLEGRVGVDSDRRNERSALNRTMRSGIFGSGDILAQLIDDTVDMPDLFSGRRDDDNRRTLREIRDEFTDLRLVMGGFMNTMASLLPLFGVFVGALPAAIAGLGALAAAAVATAAVVAAPIGLGLGSMMFANGELNVSQLQDQIRNLLNTFLEAFTPIMEALEPLMIDMFRQAEFVIRDLAARSNMLLRVTDEIGGMFDWLGQVIGPALEDLMRFGHAAMPVMELLVGGLASFDWFKIFASLLRQTLPLMDIFVTHLVSILPSLFEISMGFFMVADAIMVVAGLLAQVINVVPFLGEGLGVLIGLLLTAASATALYSTTVDSVLARLFMMALEALPAAVMSIHGYIASVTSATFATWAMVAAVSALLGVLTFGVAPALSGIVGSFIGLGDGVGYATDQLGRFESQANSLNNPTVGGDTTPYGRFAAGQGTTVVAPDKETGNAVSNSLRFKQNGTDTVDQSSVDDQKHSK